MGFGASLLKITSALSVVSTCSVVFTYDATRHTVEGENVCTHHVELRVWFPHHDREHLQLQPRARSSYVFLLDSNEGRLF